MRKQVIRAPQIVLSEDGNYPVREIEDYAVDVVDVGVLELIIVPDKSGGETRASLIKMRIA